MRRLCLKMLNHGEGDICEVHVSVCSYSINILKECCGELFICEVWREFYRSLLVGAGFLFCRWQVPVWVALQASDLENGLKALENAP